MRLIHLFNWYRPDADTQRRAQIALQSWRAAGCDSYQHELGPRDRSSADVGDAKRVPFLRDVWDAGCRFAREGDGVIYCNLDVGIIPGGLEVITDCLAKVPCCYSYRTDFPRLDKPPESLEGGTPYVGADLFAFTPQWWRENRERMPDFLLSYEGWDAVVKLLMAESGFESMPSVIFHELHEAHWKGALKSPGNLHNRKLGEAWAHENGYAHLLHVQPPFLF